MKKCLGCGNELPESAKFCPNCGTAYAEPGEQAAEVNVNTAKSICEQCGLELPVGAKFCTVCGGQATTGVSMLKPTTPVMPAAASSGMMMSVSVEEELAAKEAEAQAQAAPVIPVATIAPSAPASATPVAPVTPVVTPAPVAPVVEEEGFIPEMGAIPEMGSVSEDIEPTPSVYSTMTASPVEATPSVSSTMGVQTIPTAQPVTPVTPVQPVAQPVQTAQPVNNVTNVNNVNTLPNSGVISNAMPVNNVANATNVNNVNTLPNAGVATAVDYSKMQPVQKKKMKVGGKIAIVIGSVVGAAAVAAGVLFFTNKAAFLSTILGKEKYAVMVESQSIQQTAAAIDTDAIVKSVETLSGAYSAIATLNSDMSMEAIPMSSAIGSADSATTVKLYNGSTSSSAAMGMMDYSEYSGMDFSAYIGYLNKMYTETFGANGVKMDMGFEVEVRDGLKSLIGGEDVPVDDIVALINGMSVSYDITAGETAFDTTIAAKADTLEVDCRVVMTDQNEMYLALPFVSGKAFYIKMPKGESTVEMPEETVTLKLDKKELDRIVSAVVETYLVKYKESAIEMENGSVELAGEKIEGKAITAEFAGDKLSDLFESMFNVIAEDEYLCDTIVNYLNEIGMEYTAEDYKTAIEDVVDFEATDDDKLIITTIIDKNGNPLAKTYTAIDDTSDEVIIGYSANDSRVLFEMSIDAEEDVDDMAMTLNCTKKSETSGDMKFAMKAEGEEMCFNVSYSDAGVKQFCGQDTTVGTYKISFEMPESFEEQLGEEGFAAINGLTIEVSQSVDGGTASSAIAVDVADYGRVAVKMNMSVQDNSDPAIPTDFIDVTSAMENGEPDQQTIDALKAYMDDFGKVYDAKFVPFLEKYADLLFAGEVPEFTNPFDIPVEPDTPGVDEALTVEELKEYIDDDYLSLVEDYAQIPSDKVDLLAEAVAIAEGYNTLKSAINAETEMTEDKLAAYTQQYWDLFYRLLALEDQIYAAYESFQALSPDVDVNSIAKMQYTEVAIVYAQCETALSTYTEFYSEQINSNATLKALYDAADYARIDMERDWAYFIDQLDRGSININLLTTARNTLKEYLTALRALEAELAEVIE